MPGADVRPFLVQHLEGPRKVLPETRPLLTPPNADVTVALADK